MSVSVKTTIVAAMSAAVMVLACKKPDPAAVDAGLTTADTTAVAAPSAPVADAAPLATLTPVKKVAPKDGGADGAAADAAAPASSANAAAAASANAAAAAAAAEAANNSTECKNARTFCASKAPASVKSCEKFKAECLAKGGKL